jgi:hypothetical protein
MRQDLQNLGIDLCIPSLYDSAQNGLAEVSVKTHIDDASVLMFSSVPSTLVCTPLARSCAQQYCVSTRGGQVVFSFQLLSRRAAVFNPSL